MEKLFSVAIGGAAGALARYGTVVIYQRYAPTSFPLAILTVNVLGSLLFGLVWAYAEDRDWISENMRLLVLTGFMGSFTTFSTFAFDEAMFLRGGSWPCSLRTCLSAMLPLSPPCSWVSGSGR